MNTILSNIFNLNVPCKIISSSPRTKLYTVKGKGNSGPKGWCKGYIFVVEVKNDPPHYFRTDVVVVVFKFLYVDKTATPFLVAKHINELSSAFEYLPDENLPDNMSPFPDEVVDCRLIDKTDSWFALCKIE